MQLEKKDAQLGEILKASNLEPGALGPVERKLEDLLANKNGTIEELQMALAEITQQHERVVLAYENYLSEHGVSGLLP
eukprot:NODE_11794_length_296_cov_9.672065_g10881_i0.p1 GENE.NODE_11794_length_296_cov_9.672065_g10881_i0~~NODE_11794_length_296_cov_9.672065_g10881_i0.p1  ORF type:complete len:90 (+),score=43.75 NODE_11794_length_296_cov_9.672065_g10881_i0:38-271(+)